VENEAAVETDPASASDTPVENEPVVEADPASAADTPVESEPTVEADPASASDTPVESEPAVEAGPASAGEAEPIPPDDLIRIEGIGPKISTIVAAAGITTFSELAGLEVVRLEAILHAAGIHTANPSTWPDQANLAAQGKWAELQELQDRIKNGRLEA